MFKKISLSAFFICVLVVMSFAQVNNFTMNYKGTVGNVKVTLSITSDWHNYQTTYTGTYYYDHVGKELSLRGVWLARLETIELTEVGDGNVVTGYFSLKGDPQKFYDVLTGTWTSLDKKRTLPVRLTKVN
ncbi:hypothetical protein [Raineya orbicola]|jgi:hypothetical protein|uniref:Uncharacterized protein n=1 Tax=Raineya orbicola TaxID=2016530 RepID=A0A2N3IH89_9BACT|nr:hypothetical protein [Raineya orbicola]PKQ69720.1 hypothetical protein Rain11_1283 [Raineya orbicola]